MLFPEKGPAAHQEMTRYRRERDETEKLRRESFEPIIRLAETIESSGIDTSLVQLPDTFDQYGNGHYGGQSLRFGESVPTAEDDRAMRDWRIYIKRLSRDRLSSHNRKSGGWTKGTGPDIYTFQGKVPPPEMHFRYEAYEIYYSRTTTGVALTAPGLAGEEDISIPSGKFDPADLSAIFETRGPNVSVDNEGFPRTFSFKGRPHVYSRHPRTGAGIIAPDGLVTVTLNPAQISPTR